MLLEKNVQFIKPRLRSFPRLRPALGFLEFVQRHPEARAASRVEVFRCGLWDDGARDAGHEDGEEGEGNFAEDGGEVGVEIVGEVEGGVGVEGFELGGYGEGVHDVGSVREADGGEGVRGALGGGVGWDATETGGLGEVWHWWSGTD